MTNQFSRRSTNRPATAREALTPTQNVKKLTIRLDADIHKQLHQIAISTDQTMQDISARLITDFVNKNTG